MGGGEWREEEREEKGWRREEGEKGGGGLKKHRERERGGRGGRGERITIYMPTPTTHSSAALHLVSTVCCDTLTTTISCPQLT